MTDIVERLRDGYADKALTKDIIDEAADEIERLRDTLVEIDELVEEYADADDGQPNLAMRIMTMVREIIAPRG